MLMIIFPPPGYLTFERPKQAANILHTFVPHESKSDCESLNFRLISGHCVCAVRWHCGVRSPARRNMPFRQMNLTDKYRKQIRRGFAGQPTNHSTEGEWSAPAHYRMHLSANTNYLFTLCGNTVCYVPVPRTRTWMVLSCVCAVRVHRRRSRKLIAILFAAHNRNYIWLNFVGARNTNFVIDFLPQTASHERLCLDFRQSMRNPNVSAIEFKNRFIPRSIFVAWVFSSPLHRLHRNARSGKPINHRMSSLSFFASRDIFNASEARNRFYNSTSASVSIYYLPALHYILYAISLSLFRSFFIFLFSEKCVSAPSSFRYLSLLLLAL